MTNLKSSSKTVPEQNAEPQPDESSLEITLTAQPPVDRPATVDDALEAYLEEIGKSRATSTLTTYHYTINNFKATLTKNKFPPATTPLTKMTPEWAQWFLDDLRRLQATTERSYLAPVIGFYEYVVAKNWLDLNLTEMRYFVKRRQRKLPQKAQRFPKQQIEKLLHAMDTLVETGPFETDRDKLTALRDRSLFYLLADTGLRVSEACSLTCDDVDFDESELFVTGKGNKEARLPLSRRAQTHVQSYLHVRDLFHNTPLPYPADLPLFSRHDKRAGKNILPLSARSVQQSVDRWVSQFLGQKYLYEITPHSFRHYFVTVVLRGTGGDVEVAKKLARHADISTTMRYAHLSDDELDQKYYEIFDE